MIKTKGMYNQVHLVKIGLKKEEKKKKKIKKIKKIKGIKRI